jgi:F0F1-type ATP synthase membrane subunit b/b'
MNFNDIFDFIQLVKDPKKYEAKLAELKAYDASIKANIALSDDVNDIETAKKLAAEALNKNNAILAEANKEAAKIMDGARAVYDQKFQELGATQREAENAIAKQKQQELVMKQQANALAKDQSDIADLRAQLQAERQQVAQLQKEVDERLEKLKSVMG